MDLEHLEDVHNSFRGLLRHAGLVHGFHDFATKRPFGLGEDQKLCDGRIQRLLGARQPHGLQMALHQLSVREVEQRWSHRSVDHLLGIAEEVLVVRALGRAVRDHERRLPAPARASTSLGIVGGRGGHVAHVHGVER